MKTILTNIKATLQGTTALSYVSDSAIVVETDNNYVPAHISYPAITIKDGAIVTDHSYQSSGFDIEYRVNLNLWQALLDDDKSIVGSGSTKGVLDLQADIHSVLHENLLGISGMIDAYCKEESPSEVVSSEDLVLVRKQLVYTYRKIEEK